jgi:PilX N-terminal
MNMHLLSLPTCHRGQDGSIILIVLIVLALVTIIGISVTNMSSTEMQISSNDKDYKITFYAAESGNYGMAKWLTRVLDDRAIPAKATGKTNFTYLDTNPTTDLLNEVMGYSGAYDTLDDLEFTMAYGVDTSGSGSAPTTTNDVKINLKRLLARQAVGGGAEFGTGASGIGEKTAIEIPFSLTSDATSTSGTHATVTSEYLKLLGVPGGL